MYLSLLIMKQKKTCEPHIVNPQRLKAIFFFKSSISKVFMVLSIFSHPDGLQNSMLWEKTSERLSNHLVISDKMPRKVSFKIIISAWSNKIRRTHSLTLWPEQNQVSTTETCHVSVSFSVWLCADIRVYGSERARIWVTIYKQLRITLLLG